MKDLILAKKQWLRFIYFKMAWQYKKEWEQVAETGDSKKKFLRRLFLGEKCGNLMEVISMHVKYKGHQWPRPEGWI